MNFNVPVTDKLPLENCTAFILWTGSTDFKLLPYTARSPTAPAAGVSASPEVVLSITDVQGRLLKLAMFGSKPFYLSVTPVVRKQSLTVQEQPPQQQQQSPHVVLKSSSAQLLSRKEGGAEIEIEAKEAEGKQKPSSSPLPPIIIKRCPENYVGCGLNECIHGHFACDSVAQCATDELSCFDSKSLLLLNFHSISNNNFQHLLSFTTSPPVPSDAFLLLSFTGVMLTFGLVSLFLGLYVYVRFYSRYQPAFLLSADYKPTYYGTAVNGSFIGSNGCANGASGSSTASLSSSSSTSLLVGHSRPPRHQLYERNISLQQGQGRLLNKK